MEGGWGDVWTLMHTVGGSIGNMLDLSIMVWMQSRFKTCDLTPFPILSPISFQLGYGVIEAHAHITLSLSLARAHLRPSLPLLLRCLPP